MAGGRIEAVAFDLDGTLVDSVGDLHAIAAQLFSEHALEPLGREAIATLVGAGIPALVERCFAMVGRPLSGAPLAAAIERYKRLYAAAPVVHTTLYPGVAEALARLHADGLRLAVCTNKAEAISRAVLDALGVGRLIGAVVGGDTLPVRKPDPAMLRRAAETVSAPIEGLVFVGDSEIDAATAAAAGVPLLLFTRGYRKTPVDALRHAAAFDDFRDLPRLVAWMSQARPPR